MKALCIDDDKLIQFILTKMFNNLGLEVVMAANGREGLWAYSSLEAEIGLIVLDLEMPEMDGFEFLERISSFYGNKHPPVYIHSSYTEDVILEKFGSRDIPPGMVAGYLNKPVDIRQLRVLTGHFLA